MYTVLRSYTYCARATEDVDQRFARSVASPTRPKTTFAMLGCRICAGSGTETSRMRLRRQHGCSGVNSELIHVQLLTVSGVVKFSEAVYR